MTDIRYINIRGRTVTMLIAFLPVLSMYGVGLGESISAFDFLLVVLVIFLGVYSLFHGSIQGVYNKKEILLFPFLLYMIFGLIFHLLDGFNESLFLKTGRLILYFIFIIVYLRGSFSSLNGYKLLEILALFVVFYLCFQNVVLLLFNYYVPGFLTFIPVLRGELFDHSETGGGISFRARSILGEPSEIGLVVGLYLLITLLLMEKYRIQSFVMKFKVAFASFGLVISLSATGAAMLFLSCFHG